MPVAETLVQAIRSDPQLKDVTVLEPILVQAYSIGEARARIAAALSEHLLQGEQVHLNLTGGTKLMSLAALQAAFGAGVQLLYVSTEENQNIMLGSDGAELGREPIQVKISVAQYLAAHGLEMKPDVRFDPERNRFASPPPKEGDELEMRVYQLAVSSGMFDDVQRCIHIRKHTEHGLVENELDLTVTRNGRLAVCSCKVGANVKKETVYELASLSRREAAGIYCGKLLLSQEILTSIRDRARTMDVRLVYGGEIDNIVEHLLAATR